MRILLVGAVDRTRKLQMRNMPLGLAYIAAYLRERVPGIQVRITYRGIAKEIAAFQPDVLGISSVSANYAIARSLARLGKQFGHARVEALACGVAVIGPSSGEIPYDIGDEKLVLPVGDSLSLREDRPVDERTGFCRRMSPAWTWCT